MTRKKIRSTMNAYFKRAIGPNSLKDFAEVVLRMGMELLARQRRHPREAARHQQPRVAGDDGRQAG